MASKVDLTGQRFGRLVVLCRDESTRKSSMWLCKCDCGNVKSIRIDHLKSGATTSCGCYNSEATSRRRKTHGMTGSPEYYAWKHMIARCERHNDSRFHCYGLRGIKVCDRWSGENGFKNFVADMGLRPGPEYSIDRINNDGNYEPSNCKWSTRVEQANNKSTSVFISYHGEKKTLGAWAREFGFNYKNVWERIRSGWSVKRAFEEPVHTNRINSGSK